MRSRGVLFFLLFLLISVRAYADQDFYGIKMKNELWAKNLVLGLGPKADQGVLRRGPVLDQAVFADAVIQNATARQLDFRVNLVNNSPAAINTDYQSRDYFIYTKNGGKIPLIDPENQWALASVLPKASVTFSPSLGNLKIRSEDILMIECSFDAGKTRIFLFPDSSKENIVKLQDPSTVDKKKSATMAPSKPSVSKKKSPEPSEKSAPPAKAPEPRVVEFDKKYNSITINLGLKEGLRRNMIIRVLRDGKILVKARVRKLSESFSTAALLSELGKTDVHVGDSIAIA